MTKSRFRTRFTERVSVSVNFDPDYSEIIDGIEVFPQRSMAKQEFIDNGNPNVIVAKYMKATGGTQQQVLHMMSAMAPATKPMYGDFSNVPDLLTAQNMLVLAEQTFMSLPSHVRSKFDNDPVAFVDYAMNPDNLEGMIDLGLLARERTSPPPSPPSNADGGTPASSGGASE